MARYRVNDAGVARARELVDSGKVDTTTEWSEAAPTAAQENDVVERDGYEAFGEWHLAVDQDASEDTKGRYGFPFGDFSRVNRAALIHAKQRATQNDHDAVARAADDLLQRLDAREG